MDSLAEANQKFVRDSAGLLRNQFRAEDMAAARPVDQNLRTDVSPANVGHIDLHLIHADSSENGGHLAVDQNMPIARETPGQTIVVTEWHYTYPSFPVHEMRAVVAESIPHLERSDGGDSASDGDRQLQSHYWLGVG